jgi:hypothetical protein
VNPNYCRVQLRPRDAGEILDLAFRLVRERWRPIAALAAWTLIPTWIAGIVACVASHGSPWVIAIPIAASPAIQAPFTLLTGQLLFDDDARVRGMLRELLPRIPSLVGAWLVWAG